MPGKVTLAVTAGPLRGRRYEFTEHDTWLFGRAPDCHAELDASDTSASRHHFLLEVNPPEVRLRDLGSLNGTHVNGVRQGGRGKDRSVEEGAELRFPEVPLRNGDEVRVGATVLRIEVEAPAACCECGRAVAEKDRDECAWVAESFLCAECRIRDELSVHLSMLVLPRPSASDAIDDEDTDPRVGTRIGPYQVGALIGKGGMGAVYHARRSGDDREIALKLLQPQVLVDRGARETFLREIEITRALRHTHIVEVFDQGESEDGFYFAMEYCPGGSVEGRLQDRRPYDTATAVRLALQALEALAFAHDRGIVHRDIKPENILIAGDGSAKLTDFGLAKSFEQAGLSGMTATGAVGGTFYFMPREQITRFRDAQPAGDVWSMGATLYYMLTKEWARDFLLKSDPLAVVLRGGIVPIRRRDPAIPETLAAVVDRAIADEPAERYPDGRAFLSALQQVPLPVPGR
jgi:hypothetical protein